MKLLAFNLGESGRLTSQLVVAAGSFNTEAALSPSVTLDSSDACLGMLQKDPVKGIETALLIILENLNK